MQAQEKKIQDVLSESRSYFIPDYQRPYSWEDKHIQQLLDDVYEAFTHQEKEYFIGSLILIERDGGRFEVVDGQQRLTTLTIIFAVLRDLLTDPEQKGHVQQRFLPKHAMTKKLESPRLMVREQDRSLFLDAVLMGNGAEEADDMSDSQLNMLRNRNTAVEFLRKLSADELPQFENYLEENVWVVWVSTGGFQSAFRLFNVLNARGLPLSNGDLIKSHLYGLLQGKEAAQTVVRESWEELEELVGLKDLDIFLSHYRTSHMANKAEKAVYEEYQGLIKQLAIAPDVFAKGLIKAAKAYRKILDNDFKESAKTRRLVASLQRVHYDEWIPPLLAFFDAGSTVLTAEEFIEWLEKATYQNWIRRLGRTQRNTTYYQLIKQIRSGGDAAGLRKIFLAGANNVEFVASLEGEVYRNAYAKAVLMRLEEAMQDESVTKSFSGLISVEHVLPQKSTAPYWQARFKPEEARQWVHRLGNLALLSGRKNSAAQNYDFDKKVKIFKERDKKVSFDLTKAVCEQSEWTLAVIQDRQTKLVEQAKGIWNIEMPSAAQQA